MDLTFANPAAWWALLGIPAVLAIHFLQSRTKHVEISTLFLIEPLAEINRHGSIWTRLRQSWQMWLQLLSVILLTWLLLQPMWMRTESVQSVALVLDQSYSMQAFHHEAVSQTSRLIRELDRSARHTDWHVISSDPAQPAFYRGQNADEAVASLSHWQPDAATHDYRKSLARARELVGADGLLIWITDHVEPVVPSMAHVMAVGNPLDNSGFTGIRFERDQDGRLEWITSLRHYSKTPATRTVQISFDDNAPAPPEKIELKPGQLTHLRGLVPENVRRGRLSLDADHYPVDDLLPFVIPQKKVLTYSLTGFSHMDEWMTRIMSTVESSRPVLDQESPVLSWKTYTGNSVNQMESGIYLYAGEKQADYAEIINENHPLTRDLNWSGFLGRVAPEFERHPGDQVLVWMGEHPLLVLRESKTSLQLIVCFDVMRSNADRLPATILCLHRFVERLREAADGYQAVNVESHQALPLTMNILAGGVAIQEERDGVTSNYTISAGTDFSALSSPGYMDVRQNDTVILDAGVHVADTMEADLTRAGSQSLDPDIITSQRVINSRRDLLAPLWFILLGLAMLGSWRAGAEGRS